MIIPHMNHTVFAFSDTNGMHFRLTIPSEADILICVGDGVEGIEELELSDFFKWYVAQPAQLRIFVAGNILIIIRSAANEEGVLNISESYL